MDRENFSFEQWCASYELNEDTVKALEKRGHKSHLSISVVVIDDIKKDFKALLPAQILLLERAVRDFNAAQSRPTDTPKDTSSSETMPTPTPSGSVVTNAPAPTGQGPLFVEDVLCQCGLHGTETVGDAGNTDIATDPYGFGAGPYSGNNLREVGKFLTFHQVGMTGEENAQYVNIGGVQLRTTEQRVPLSKITPHHYMEGSLAILRDMIMTDSMPLPWVMDHLNYLIQIARFGQVFPWQAVLRYDAVYRTQQHEVGFRWGTSSPTLMQTHLQTNMNLPQRPGAQKQPREPQSGQIICYTWNSVQGCPLFACKFLHVCRTCFSSDHPHHRHPSQQTQPKPKNV